MTTVITGPYGPFVYTVATQRWWWSDDIYRIHGFEPGEVVPTTALLVAHKHPDDAAVATALIVNALTGGEPFALWHRIIDARRRTRQVVSVGEGVRDETGTLVEVRGYMVDVTGSKRAETVREIDEAVRRSAESRGTIELAKGVIMGALSMGEEASFALLRRSSQRANVKVRDLASTLVEAVGQADGTAPACAVVAQVLGIADQPDTSTRARAGSGTGRARQSPPALSQTHSTNDDAARQSARTRSSSSGE